ncbi:MAG: hypothetical protein AB7W47_01255 [Calditrichaceae bacterium]
MEDKEDTKERTKKIENCYFLSRFLYHSYYKKDSANNLYSNIIFSQAVICK